MTGKKMQKGKNFFPHLLIWPHFRHHKNSISQTQANLPTDILKKSFPDLVHLQPPTVNTIAHQNEHRKEVAKKERRKEKKKTTTKQSNLL